MRAALVVVAILVAGCGAANQPPGSGGSGYDQYGCKLSCDKCPLQTLCVPAPYVATCLVACSTTSDCDTGRCAVIGALGGPSVCLGTLNLCDPPTACTFTPQCRDAMTALVALPPQFQQCALEPVHCDSGCDSATGSCK